MSILIILFIIFIFFPAGTPALFGIPPSPAIVQHSISDKWPPGYSIVSTEPAGRNILPGQIYFPGKKEHILVILTEFSDVGFSGLSPLNTTYGKKLDENYYSRLIFGSDFTGFKKSIKYNKKYNSLNRYIKEISYNQCELTGSIIKVKLNTSSKFYSEDSSIEVDNGNVSYYQIMKDVLIKAQSKTGNLSSFDYDQDKYLDHVIVIASIPNQATRTQKKKNRDNCIWPKRVLFTENALSLKNNKKLAWGIIASYDSTMGIFAHEFMHELGAVDLFDPDFGHPSITDNNDFPISFWGLMGQGAWNFKKGQVPGDCPSHPLGFTKWKMGWIDDYTISKNSTVIIKSIADNKKESLFRINTGSYDYFFIENRNSSLKNIYYDKAYMNSSMKMDSGLIITHIDENINFNYYNQVYTVNWSTPSYPHYAVRILDTNPFINGKYNEWKINAAFCAEDFQSTLSKYSSFVDIESYYLKKPAFSITEISRSGSSMKAKIIINKIKR